MPLFLIPLALSLLTTGAGIITQVQENQRLALAGQQAVSDQIVKNEAARVDQYSQYVNAIDAVNEQQAQLEQQAETIHAQKSRLVSMGLFATAVLMALLTLYVLVQRKA